MSTSSPFSHLPARFTELLDVDRTAERDDEDGQRVGGEAVVTNHRIQDLESHLDTTETRFTSKHLELVSPEAE